jgi:hypothetical protein
VTSPADPAGALGVVVHGMSRSGTSAVTGLFVASGYFVGDEADLMRANSGNPAGYYENLNVYKINEDLLAELGASWFDPPSEPTLLEARPRVQGRLRRVFDGLVEQAAGAPLALKDPRIAVLMGLWGPIIGDRLHPVLVVRDPVEVAQSLQARDGTPMALGLAAWELHMTSLLRSLSGATVTVAPYRVVLGSAEQARSIVEEATRHVRPDLAVNVRPSDGGGWLTVQLAHNRAGSGDHGRFLTGRQAELWEWLAGLPAGTAVLQPPAPLLTDDPAARGGAQAETARTQLLSEQAVARRALSELSERQAQTEAQLAAVTAHADTLSRELAEQRHRTSVEAQRAELAQTAHDNLLSSLESVRQSTSWRATAIFRRAGAVLRGGRGAQDSTPR